MIYHMNINDKIIEEEIFMNRWTGLGRLVRDPDVRFTDSGKCVTRFVMACNSKKNEKQYAEFVQCEAWNKTAETIGEYCGKGDQILVEGRLHTRVYEKNGEKRFYSFISVRSMEFGSKRNTQKNLPDSERQPLPDVPEEVFDDTPPIEEPPIADEDIPF